jgi:hypothetical protein
MIVQPPALLELPYVELDKVGDSGYPLTYQLDLGFDHWLKFVSWGPDFNIAGNAAKWGHLSLLIKQQPVVGAIVIHRCRTETGWHEGSIDFRTEVTQAWDEPARAHRWDVHSWQPLELSPSLLTHCPCNDHGFIRGGRWVRA